MAAFRFYNAGLKLAKELEEICANEVVGLIPEQQQDVPPHCGISGFGRVTSFVNSKPITGVGCVPAER